MLACSLFLDQNIFVWACFFCSCGHFAAKKINGGFLKNEKELKGGIMYNKRGYVLVFVVLSSPLFNKRTYILAGKRANGQTNRVFFSLKKDAVRKTSRKKKILVHCDTQRRPKRQQRAMTMKGNLYLSSFSICR